MKVNPVATEMIVSQYNRQVMVGDQVHNIAVTHKDMGNSEKVEEVTRIYDRYGRVKEIHPSKNVDYMA